MTRTGRENNRGKRDKDMENASYCEATRTGAKQDAAKSAPENLTIPKHRFDCVNLCLKETKEALREKTAEAEENKNRITELEKALLNAKVETALALHRAKNLTAAKALIDFGDLKLECDGTTSGLEEQILSIKEGQSYLFESQESLTYVLVPVRNGDGLNKSITDYIKKTEKKK